MRLIGKRDQNFAFTSFANQTVSCVVDPGVDGAYGTEDDYATCTDGTQADWVELASYNLAAKGCVKQVKLGGKNTARGGGKTPFCDITDGFLVDVDTDGDDVADLFDQFVFSVSCFDDPLTEWDETLYCPLSSVIWDIDESTTTSEAKAQVFVSHTGAARIKSGKLKPRD